MLRETVVLQERHFGEMAQCGHSIGFRPHEREAMLAGPAFAMLEDGEVFGAAGLIPLWPGAARGWAVIPIPTGNPRLLWITRQVHAFLDRLQGYHRVEVTVRADFHQGRAWVRLLEFVEEGRLRKYDQFSMDHFIYSRLY